VTLTGLEPELERALDLAGVLVFALSGASLAVRRHFDLVGILALATVTGLGGGILRDVLAREVPTVFKADSALYAIPATLGAAATAAVWSQDALDAPQAGAIAVAVLVVRLLAIRRGWRAPTART
jgi:uncharacterized membrane protein YeiH